MLENFSWITKVTLCLTKGKATPTTVLLRFCLPEMGCSKAVLSHLLQVKKSKGFFLLLISTHVSLTQRLSCLCKKKDGMWFNYSTALITHLGTVTINCTVQFINLHWILDWKKRCYQQDRVHVLFLLHVIRRPVVPDQPPTQVMFPTCFWRWQWCKSTPPTDGMFLLFLVCDLQLIFKNVSICAWKLTENANCI